MTKISNFNQLLGEYLSNQTSEEITQKIDAWMNAVSERNIQWISEETEELFYQNIVDPEITPYELVIQVRNLKKLHIAHPSWMNLTGMDIYFDIRCFAFP